MKEQEINITPIYGPENSEPTAEQRKDAAHKVLKDLHTIEMKALGVDMENLLDQITKIYGRYLDIASDGHKYDVSRFDHPVFNLQYLALGNLASIRDSYRDMKRSLNK
jgi:hypothetical protein